MTVSRGSVGKAMRSGKSKKKRAKKVKPRKKDKDEDELATKLSLRKHDSVRITRV